MDSEVQVGVAGTGVTRRAALLGGGIFAASTVIAGFPGMASAAVKAEAALDAGGPDLSRVVVWKGLDAWRSEVAAMHLDEHGIVAEGSQVAVDPMPYRVDYRLEAPRDFITRRFTLESQGPGWWRRLDLRHDGRGNWSQTTAMRGRKISLGDPGGDMKEMEGALDCDFGLSPLTNLMPILRSGLNNHPGAEDFLMAWVSTPDLGVLASGQRYEYVSTEKDGSVARYRKRPRNGAFSIFETRQRSGGGY